MGRWGLVSSSASQSSTSASRRAATRSGTITAIMPAAWRAGLWPVRQLARRFLESCEPGTPIVIPSGSCTSMIKIFYRDSLLVKSADVISNVSEILEDYRKEGPNTFRRFNAPKENVLRHYIETMETILIRWPEIPFVDDLNMLITALKNIE